MRLSIAVLACSIAVGLGGCGGSGNNNGSEPEANKLVLGGAVSGLAGTVTVTLNATESKQLSDNGSFTFQTRLAAGDRYSIVVSGQPSNQTCTVANGTGTVGASNVDNVAVTCQTNTHLLGGTVTGLVGTLTLASGGETYTTSTDGSFSFATPVAEGAPYAVSVLTQPASQTCSVSNGSGTMGTADVSTVSVVCSVNTFAVGGNVSGLNGNVTVQNNGGDTRTLSGNGSFNFATAIAQGSPYSVTIQTQPATQSCSVGNGSGIVGAGNVVDVAITCSTNAYTVGGTVSGLNGTVSLQNNAADTIAINSDGSFTFPTLVAQGSSYAVTVQSQPATQTCSVSNDSGTMGASNVTNVSVSCTDNQTTLSVATNAFIPVGSGTGTLTVTNTGSVTAFNILATLPSGWTAVIQDASNCASLAPAASCNLTFSSTAPYVAQGGIQIGASNVSSPPHVALAFTIDGFSVFSVDSASTATVLDPAAKSLATWGSAGLVGASSLTDGAANTAAMPAGGAASSCLSSTAGGASVNTWYLPAVCQLANAGGSAACPVGTPNIYDNLFALGFHTNLQIPTAYWSSTETSASNAWLVVLFADPVEVSQIRGSSQPSLCARSINY